MRISNLCVVTFFCARSMRPKFIRNETGREIHFPCDRHSWGLWPPPIFQNPGPVHPSACRLQLSRLQRRQSLPQPRPGCRSRAGGTPPACRDRWPRKRADKLPEARQRSQRHEAPVVCRRARAAGPAPGAEKPPASTGRTSPKSPRSSRHCRGAQPDNFGPSCCRAGGQQ